MFLYQSRFFVFFFNDTATTEIYTLSLHDALPISPARHSPPPWRWRPPDPSRSESGGAKNGLSDHGARTPTRRAQDRKSTRLNSSHANISYAVFCLKKKKKHICHLTSLQCSGNTLF